MKQFFLFFGLVAVIGFLPGSLGAQMHMGDGADAKVAKHGCRKVDVHCKCQNPPKDHMIKGFKLGKTNIGQKGECEAKPEIDEFFKEDAVALCEVMGIRKETTCTATWKCVEPCIIPNAK